MLALQARDHARVTYCVVASGAACSKLAAKHRAIGAALPSAAIPGERSAREWKAAIIRLSRTTVSLEQARLRILLEGSAALRSAEPCCQPKQRWNPHHRTDTV